jgi:hypothetical protein
VTNCTWTDGLLRSCAKKNGRQADARRRQYGDWAAIFRQLCTATQQHHGYGNRPRQNRNCVTRVALGLAPVFSLGDNYLTITTTSSLRLAKAIGATRLNFV